MQIVTTQLGIDQTAQDIDSLLRTLLKDKTTQRNIVWASPSYEGMGKSFCSDQPIRRNLLVGKHQAIVQPRVAKHARKQEQRTRSSGEVFTPPWLVDKQVSAVLEEWNDMPLKEWVGLRWLELACGEAPYIVTRYDSVTGDSIPVPKRVGCLDRKLQRISQEVTSEKEFIKLAKLAYESTYGYELQGDSLLLARENVLLSFCEHYEQKFGILPTIKTVKAIATIIVYNVFQMNGLTKRTPYSDRSVKEVQMNLFDTEPDSTPAPQGDMLTVVKDWKQKELVTIESISKGEGQMKFDVVIGNPPYQEQTEGTSDKPIYNYMMDGAEEVSDRVCLITPARFLFNAGKTPKEWNRKKLNDPHFKVLYYEQDSSKVFPNTDIKGGVAITYKDKEKEFGEIGTFTAFPELNSIYHKVYESDGFETFSDLIYAPESYKLTDKLHSDYPEAEMKLSKGHKYDVTTNIFDKLPEVFKSGLSKGDIQEDYIQIIGRENNARAYKWVRRDYINGPENLGKYKVILPKSNGTGAIGEVLSTPLIGEPLIGEPLIGHAQTFLSVGNFESVDTARSCMKYIKSKFARTLLGVLKVTQHNPKNTWRFVPLQDFTVDSDIDWSQSIEDIDRQLYRKYGLSQEEIEFIESKVRVMD